MNFRKQNFSLKNKKIVFLLIGWKSKIWEYYFVVVILLLNGFDCIIYEYDHDILSPNIGKTISAFNAVTNDVLVTVKELKVKGYKSFYIYGISLGTLLSIIVANKTNDIKKIILNLTSASLAETVWSWDLINKAFKKNLIDNKITLTFLEKSWEKLSPINNLDSISDKQILIYIAKKDEVIPFSQGIKLVQEMKRKKIKYELVINMRGSHISSGLVNLLRYNKYIDFLKDYKD